MPSILLTGPAIEPWSVAEAKSFLRAENDDDDTVVASLIAAARNQVEALTRSALIAQTWRLRFRRRCHRRRCRDIRSGQGSRRDRVTLLGAPCAGPRHRGH